MHTLGALDACFWTSGVSRSPLSEEVTACSITTSIRFLMLLILLPNHASGEMFPFALSDPEPSPLGPLDHYELGSSWKGLL